MSNLYFSIYFGLYEWYSGEFPENGRGNEVAVVAWAFQSVFCTFLVIFVEEVLFIFADISLVLRSGLNWPEFALYAWSYPIWLIVNFYLFLVGGKGVAFVRQLWRMPTAVQKRARIKGYSFAILTSAGALITAIKSPPL